MNVSLALLHPVDGHHGRTDAIIAARQRVLDGAHRCHPERFVRSLPTQKTTPTAAWINPLPMDRSRARSRRAGGRCCAVNSCNADSNLLTRTISDHTLEDRAKDLRTRAGALLAAPENAHHQARSLTDTPLRYAHVTYQPTDNQIAIELLRPATTKPCFYGETDARDLDPRNELDYRTHEKYLARAVGAYTQLFDWLERHQSWSPEEAAQVASVSQIVHELAGEVRVIRPDTAAIRGKLARVIEFDRSTLQRRPEVREVERSCAAWASESERASQKKIANGVHLDPGQPRTILPVNTR